MAIEFEVKYAATPEQLARILEDHPGPWSMIPMETTYYDTPDGDIAARKWTLRRRLEDGRSVCTLKTPVSDDPLARNEWETECVCIENSVTELCAQGAPSELYRMVRRDFVPVCGARFTRWVRGIKLRDGTEGALSLDQGFLFAPGHQRPFCEVELELIHGCQEAVETEGLALAARYGLVLQPLSKFKRAHDLRRLNDGL